MFWSSTLMKSFYYYASVFSSGFGLLSRNFWQFFMKFINLPLPLLSYSLGLHFTSSPPYFTPSSYFTSPSNFTSPSFFPSSSYFTSSFFTSAGYSLFIKLWWSVIRFASFSLSVFYCYSGCSTISVSGAIYYS